MRALFSLFCLGLLLSFCGGAAAQSGRGFPRTGSTPGGKANTPQPAPSPSPSPALKETEDVSLEDISGDDLVRVETQLVTVPIVVRDRNDRYIADMRQEEFSVYEDDTPQEIAFFGTTTEPFHVVLMLDTSASTQDKLRQIQDAAYSFTTQLQPVDRVKIISFADQVLTLCDFTSDREELKRAINRVRSGQGTSLYDAMSRAVASLLPIKGRRAIVIFTDGVDTTSGTSSYNKNIRALEEMGIIVYPIRYDTRAEVEAMIRQQRRNGGMIDLGTILGGRTGGTPPTMPGGTSTPAPRAPQPSSTGGLPSLGGIIIGGRRTTDPRYPDPNDPRYPNPNDPRYPSPSDPTNYPGSSRRNDGITDSERAELDMLYRTGDAYLRDLAGTTGGSLFRADYLGQLPAAFDQIAAELRTQYALGYYPTNKARDGKFRKVKVKTTRPNAAVRARPGYRAPSEGKG